MDKKLELNLHRTGNEVIRDQIGTGNDQNYKLKRTRSLFELEINFHLEHEFNEQL